MKPRLSGLEGLLLEGQRLRQGLDLLEVAQGVVIGRTRLPLDLAPLGLEFVPRLDQGLIGLALGRTDGAALVDRHGQTQEVLGRLDVAAAAEQRAAGIAFVQAADEIEARKMAAPLPPDLTTGDLDGLAQGDQPWVCIARHRDPAFDVLGIGTQHRHAVAQDGQPGHALARQFGQPVAGITERRLGLDDQGLGLAGPGAGIVELCRRGESVFVPGLRGLEFPGDRRPVRTGIVEPVAGRKHGEVPVRHVPDQGLFAGHQFGLRAPDLVPGLREARPGGIVEDRQPEIQRVVVGREIGAALREDRVVAALDVLVRLDPFGDEREFGQQRGPGLRDRLATGQETMPGRREPGIVCDGPGIDVQQVVGPPRRREQAHHDEQRQQASEKRCVGANVSRLIHTTFSRLFILEI